MSKVIAPEREQLKKMFQVGTPATVTSADGTEVELWLEKINPSEHKEAVRHSYKPRARTLALLKDKNDPERLGFQDTLTSWGIVEKETQIRFLLSQDFQKIQMSTEARIAAEKEWADNDYLITLQESWNDGLKEQYDLDKEDPDASKVYKELKRYSDIVEKLVKRDTEDLIEDWKSKSDEVVLEKVTDFIIEFLSNQEQIAEYNAWLIYFATRLPNDHSERFFLSREDIDEYGEEVYDQLYKKYEEMVIDQTEGKD